MIETLEHDDTLYPDDVDNAIEGTEGFVKSLERIQDIQNSETLDTPAFKKNKVSFFVDTEFTKKQTLSLQVRAVGIIYTSTGEFSFDFSFLLIDSFFKTSINDKVLKYLEAKKASNLFFAYDELTANPDEDWLLTYFLKYLYNLQDFPFKDTVGHKLTFKTNFVFYYSMKDLYTSLGKSFILDLIKTQQIRQRRATTGYFNLTNSVNNLEGNFEISLFDLFGLSNGGLKWMANTYGIATDSNEKLEGEKHRMDNVLSNQTELFIEYAMNDTDLLKKILDATIEAFNSILNKTFGITDYVFTPPLTFRNLTLSEISESEGG